MAPASEREGEAVVIAAVGSEAAVVAAATLRAPPPRSLSSFALRPRARRALPSTVTLLLLLLLLSTDRCFPRAVPRPLIPLLPPSNCSLLWDLSLLLSFAAVTAAAAALSSAFALDAATAALSSHCATTVRSDPKEGAAQYSSMWHAAAPGTTPDARRCCFAFCFLRPFNERRFIMKSSGTRCLL